MKTLKKLLPLHQYVLACRLTHAMDFIVINLSQTLPTNQKYGRKIGLDGWTRTLSLSLSLYPILNQVDVAY